MNISKTNIRDSEGNRLASLRWPHDGQVNVIVPHVGTVASIYRKSGGGATVSLYPYKQGCGAELPGFEKQMEAGGHKYVADNAAEGLRKVGALLQMEESSEDEGSEEQPEQEEPKPGLSAEARHLVLRQVAAKARA